MPLPLAEGTGPQNRREVVTDLFQQHYKDLLRHARRHIHQDELAGDIPRGALDPKDIVDEVAREAMAKVDKRPKGMSWVSWFYHLVHLELKRQHWLLKHKRTEEISTDETKTLPEDAERAAGYDVEQPLDIIEKNLEPPVVRTVCLIPDSTAMPPDEFVAQKDALAKLLETKRLRSACTAVTRSNLTRPTTSSRARNDFLGRCDEVRFIPSRKKISNWARSENISK